MKAKDSKIFLEALDELEKEKGISKESVLEAIELALLAAYKKNYGEDENVEVVVDRENWCSIIPSPTILAVIRLISSEIKIEIGRPTPRARTLFLKCSRRSSKNSLVLRMPNVRYTPNSCFLLSICILLAK